MSTQLHSKEDIPYILAEMSIEEKAELLTGATNYGTHAFPQYGIPAVLMIDNGCGVNLRQWAQELVHRGLVQSTPDGIPESRMAYIMDQIEHRENLSEEENAFLDRVLNYLRKNYVKSGELPSCFPVNSLLASSWNPEVIREVGRETGKVASAYGVDVLLGTPCVNIIRDPRGGRNFECWSEDPYLTGELAKEYPLGVQETGVLANVKHFAVNNQETWRRTVDAKVSERALREIYFPAFQKVVQVGKVKTVMTSYNKFNGTYTSENKWMIEDILRGEWNFAGMVVSDWGGVYHRGPSTTAGNDLCMPHRFPAKYLVEAYEAGEVTMERIDAACNNVLQMILSTPVFNGRKYTEIDVESGKRVAYKAAADSIILLKNDGVLPLNKSNKVSFYGYLSYRFNDCGVGSGRVHTDKTSSMFRSAELIMDNTPLFNKVTENTDVVVVTVTARGQEGADRSNLNMEPEDEIVLKNAIDDAKRVNARVVLILNIAAPVDLRKYINDIDAILCVYFPGEQGAKATADILFGIVNPSGKLAQTYPKRYEDCLSSLNFPGEYERVNYGEGIFVGYRAFDKLGITPLFPFGFGLSYTTFSFKNLSISSSLFDIENNESITVSVEIKNTGNKAGAEVVQLYISDPVSTQPKPVRELKGFKKVYLEPGESKIVSIEIKKEQFYSFDEKFGWVVEPGFYEIEVGNSSRNILCHKTIKVYGTNPYGYGLNSVYLYVMQDKRATDAMNSVFPEAFLTQEEINRETNYVDMNITLRKGLESFFKRKIPNISDDRIEALLSSAEKAVSKIDVTDIEQKYAEHYVD